MKVNTLQFDWEQSDGFPTRVYPGVSDEINNLDVLGQ